MTGRSWGMLVLVLAALGVLSWKAVLVDRLERARDINAFVLRENTRLEREVEEVKDLRDHVAAVLERKAVLEAILPRANLAPEAIGELSRLPRDVVLERVVVKGGRIVAEGEAASEGALARVLPALADARYAGKFRLQPVEGASRPAARRFRLEAEVATPSGQFGPGAGS